MLVAASPLTAAERRTFVATLLALKRHGETCGAGRGMIGMRRMPTAPTNRISARSGSRCCSRTSSFSLQMWGRRPAGRHQEHDRHGWRRDQGLLAPGEHREQGRRTPGARRRDPGSPWAGHSWRHRRHRIRARGLVRRPAL